MQQIVCGESDLQQDLSDYVRQGRPVSLALSPYVGDLRLELTLNIEGPIQLVCCSLPSANSGYPHVTYCQSFEDLPQNTYCLFGRLADRYIAIACMSQQDQVARLHRGTPLVLRTTSGTSRRANQVRPALVVCSGSELYSVVEQAMTGMRRLSSGRVDQVEATPPRWLHELGWSTSLTYHREVNHDQILDAVWALHQKGVRLSYVLVGEGWQQLSMAPVDRASMLGFDASLSKFPRGLRGLVEDLKAAGVERVGVWHGLMGYRGGVHADLAKLYDLPPDRQGRYFPGYDLGKTFEFFHDYYTYLAQQGISFVMVGDQGAPHQFCRPGMDVTALYQNLQTAVGAASGIFFGGAVLTGEGLNPEGLVHWKKGMLARSSEDLDLNNPVGPMRAIRNGLINGVWMQHFMRPVSEGWCSLGPANETLAIYHALSGSPSILGDPPHQHDIGLLNRVVLPNGKMAYPDRPLRPYCDDLFEDPIDEPEQAFRAHTMRGNTGVVGLFNLASGKRGLKGTVAACQIPEQSQERYALFSYRRGFIGVVEREQQVEYRLKPQQSDVYTFAPICRDVALIGAYPYFLTAGPVKSWSVEEEVVVIRTSVAVPLLLYCDRQIFEVRRNGQAVPWDYDSKRQLLTIASKTEPSPEPSVYTVALA